MPQIDVIPSFADAERLGHDLYNLKIAGWGNMGTLAKPDLVTWPPAADNGGSPTDGTPALPNLAAVAIGPRSSVDQVRVLYNQGIEAVAPLHSFKDYQANERLLTKDAPIDFTLQGGLKTSINRITFRALPFTCYADTYVAEGNDFTSPFGAVEPKFRTPLLDLYLYFRRPPGALPTARGSYEYAAHEVGYTGPGETLLGIFPAFGRRRLSLMVRPTGTAVMTIRVAEILYTMQGRQALTTPINAEKTLANLGPADAVAADVVRYQSTTLDAQYVAVYYNLTGGAGGADVLLRLED